VGSTVELGGRGGTPAEVIGVSGDARFYTLDQAPVPLYAIQQRARGGTTLVIRVGANPDAVMGMVRASLTRPDVPLSLASLQTMDAVLESSLLVARAVSSTLIAIGLLAVLLATIGLYGVVSYITAGRTREFGIRLALGATPGSISRLVVGYGVKTTLIGGALGTAAGLGAMRALDGMLFGARGSLGIVAAVWAALGAVTLLACTLPAWRATAIPPASALRAD
jgi:putative ABC transport system permease protein